MGDSSGPDGIRPGSRLPPLTGSAPPGWGTGYALRRPATGGADRPDHTSSLPVEYHEVRAIPGAALVPK